ncbi:hypothetical protein ACFL3W_01280 [Pseudomonadota bacterium]
MPDLLANLNETLGNKGFHTASYDELFDVLSYAGSDQIEGLSYAYCEIRRRGRDGKISKADRICEERDVIPIPWLSEVRAVLGVLDPPRPANYKASTYVILRDGYTDMNGFYGAYVGVTAKTPDERLNEHLTPGHPRAANGLPAHGKCLLRTLMHPFVKVPARLRLQYETSLHLALSLAVPKVTGDIQNDYLEWLPEFQPRLMAALESEC